MSATKAELRAAVIARRRAVPARVRDAEARALTGHMVGLGNAGQIVCAYVPVGSEPGSLDMLDVLVADGVQVLLPVVDGDGPLRWGAYVPGELVAARFGLLEPAGPTQPVEAVADAATVLVPALAVDRSGVRLGRGAGFYDRSLPMASANARLIAVVRDDELVDELPAEPHDVPMTHVLTPGGGLVAVGTGE
ncbi:5-formyltetrahydrofolate cyclo-ligase [Mycolicibacterium flavescens]|uniref:5-formyltetrahydrofolate cyclo-ligase n=1 Tax=Mycolicibacterium flavescens TaxID=1776 RepID=A0A1E3REB7_MYCFV|nr:5-formyltetrahydrofolate cyclo-ligase [Mycolicibacterium flavescens]MCV7282704.1 5-formyltetrahydrofolate cyclo-ligase [Mycolicibacterium flavescens]ODQ88184.1 5-formyltetrahydrofolate cyclo-ligase [Mycolicibacterium flavescens]